MASCTSLCANESLFLSRIDFPHTAPSKVARWDRWAQDGSGCGDVGRCKARHTCCRGGVRRLAVASRLRKPQQRVTSSLLADECS